MTNNYNLDEADIWDIAEAILEKVDKLVQKENFKGANWDEYRARNVANVLKKKFNRLKIKWMPL